MLAEKNLYCVQVVDFNQPVRIGLLSFILMKALGASPLPHLVFLRLRHWEDKEKGSFAVGQELDAPALRELHLETLFFSRINAPQLRVLTVTHNYEIYCDWTRGGIQASMLLGALRGMPLLERLELEGVVAQDGTDSTDENEDIPRAELPRLHFLRLKEGRHSLGFYRSVRAAASADVNVEYTSCNPGASLPDTFAALEGHLRAPTYDMLIVKDEDGGGGHVDVRLRASGSARTHYEEDGMPEFRLDASMDYDADEPLSSLEIVELLVPRIDVANIRFLDLGGIGPNLFIEVQENEVCAALAPFTGVTSLQLGAYASMRHVHALRQGDAEEDENDDENNEDGESCVTADADVEHMLPALQNLIIEGLATQTDVRELEETWNVVLVVLEDCKRAGKPIRFLMLTDWERFLGAKGNELASLKACDTRCVLRAEELVERIFDVRGVGVPWDDRRISEYVREL